MPNITSHIQPLDVGCIHTAKALYRKRHMAWILDQLRNTPEGETPMLRCTIRQAIEWFVAALNKDVSDAFVRNCWVAVKIWTPTRQMEDLRTGEEAVDLDEEEADATAECMIELADVDACR
eukprot:jgi/Tetstr1/427772/TSEL_017890.t1